MMRPVFAVRRGLWQVGFFAPMNLRTTVRVTRPTEDRSAGAFRGASETEINGGLIRAQ